MKDPIERQDAIDALADYIHNVDKVIGTGHLSAGDCKDAATSVLEDVPSAQSESIKPHVDSVLTEEGIKNLKQKIVDSPILLFPPAQPEADCGKCIFCGFPGFKQFQPKAEERTAELVQNVSDSDLIFRKAAIDAVTNDMTVK